MSAPLRLFRAWSYLIVTACLVAASSVALLAPSPVAARTADDSTECKRVAIDKEEWPDYGLVGRRSYESPQFGTTADWDRPWTVNENSDFPIESNEDCHYDVIRLIWEDGDRYGLLILNVGTPSDAGSMDELVDGWSSKKFLRSNWGKGFTGDVAVADADETTAEAVFSVVRDEDGAQYYVIYRTVALSKDTWLYLTFTTDEASLEDAWAALDEGVQVDGEPIPAVLSWREIQRAI